MKKDESDLQQQELGSTLRQNESDQPSPLAATFMRGSGLNFKERLGNEIVRQWLVPTTLEKPLTEA